MDNESLYIYGATLMMVIGTFFLPGASPAVAAWPQAARLVQHLAEVHPYRHFRRADFPRHFPER